MMSGYALPPLSEPEIAARLLALLVQHDEKASLSLERMYELCPQQIRQSGISKERRLRRLLEKFPRLFTLSEINGTVLVQSAFQIRLCEAHCSKAGCQIPQACNGLHICKFYILGNNCTFSYHLCKFGHELNTEHNLRVLQPLGIQLELESIQNLVRSRRSGVSCPAVCNHYNVQSGCRYGDAGGDCHALHVCKFYLQGKCTFGANCKRSHNFFDAQPKLILERHGIDTHRSPQEVLQEIQGAYPSSPTATAPPPAAAAAAAAAATLPVAVTSLGSTSSVKGKRDDGEEEDDDDHLLCIYHLRGRCSYGQSCKNHHGQKPYQWQFLEPDSSKVQQGWKDFSDTLNQRLEVNFCDPGIDTYNVNTEAGRPIKANFQRISMQAASLQQSCPIRRLSTLSTVKAPPFHQFTTRWCWYWQDESGNWTKYGQGSSQTAVPTVTSEDLETAFQQNSQGSLEFKTSSHQYVLSFSKMVQQNVQHKTIRKIKRRPSQQDQGGSPHVWCWYWHDESGNWTEYGQGNSQTAVSTIKSEDIETAFQQNSQGSLKFKTSAHQYVLSFSKMVQQNVKHKTIRKIERRPIKQDQGGSPRVWCWYWQDESGNWIKYGQSNSQTAVATITSEDIETAFQQNSQGSWKFNTSEQQYVLSFSQMVQQNVKYKTIRKIERRPIKQDQGGSPHVWCWYWQDESGNWIKYGQSNSQTAVATVTSEDIETAFQQNSQGSLKFNTSEQQYVLSFSQMVQQNVKHKTIRKIERRPIKQYQGGSPHVHGSASLKPPQSAGTPRGETTAVGGTAVAAAPRVRQGGSQLSALTPPHWTGTVDNPSGSNCYQMVEIQKAGATRGEFENVETLFQTTLSSEPVKAIHRIQNVELWAGYMWKKGCLERRLGAGKSVAEKQLFHGTRQKYVSAICKQGFDWRISGRSAGTRLGKGSYFARDASYSARYTKCRQMFVVRTLVGEWTAGNATMVRPPGKDPSKPDVDLFDSCVDHIANPSIYVIFCAEQAYPEYLISY